MPALQVRDFPDDLYERLKAAAAKNHRSIAQQTVAFVEAQLNQEDAKSAAILAPDFSVPFVTPNVREASARARDVGAFDWLRDFEEEPEEVIEARRKKRRQLREQAKELSKAWIGPKPTADQIAEMIREEREARTDRIMQIAEEYHEEMRKRHDGA
ncbi:MAG: argininosuccinate lyase [Eggerthellaceae bacterium]|nr:argininosuccinate lyase [Eggerthellaceae bacterium]